MTLRKNQKENEEKKQKGVSTSRQIFWITTGIAVYFLLGSWQLALVFDQMKCLTNKSIPCMLPSDINRMPYGGGSTSKVTNVLTKIKTGDGFKPFDIFNGSPQWPYNLSNDPGVVSSWFGNMQRKAWSIPRELLSGFLSLFDFAKDNVFLRFILTWFMPMITSIALFLQPLVAFFSCVWGGFDAEPILGIISFFIPIITIGTCNLQFIHLLTYLFLTGPGLGSGLNQLHINLNKYWKPVMAFVFFGYFLSWILFLNKKFDKNYK